MIEIEENTLLDEGVLQEAVEFSARRLRSRIESTEQDAHSLSRPDSDSQISDLSEKLSLSKEYIENLQGNERWMKWSDRFVANFKWAGYVLSKEDDRILAKVREVDSGSGEYDVLELNKSEVSSGDWELMGIGSLITYSIGRMYKGKQVINAGILKLFSRPSWNVSDVDGLADGARDLGDGLEID